MKKKFNKFYIMSLSILAIMFLSITYVSANSAKFSGSAGYNYARVSGANVKTDRLGTAYVDWTGSNKKSHKMWFQVVNSGDENRGKALLSYKSDKSFSTSAVTNYKYWLRASREHITNPTTNVSGNWEP